MIAFILQIIIMKKTIVFFLIILKFAGIIRLKKGNKKMNDEEIKKKAEIVNGKKASSVVIGTKEDALNHNHEIVIKPSTILEVTSNHRRGVVEDVSSNDILISKLYHQQALSKGVESGKAQAGDFIDSITGELISRRDEVLELIFITLSKTLQTFSIDKTGKKTWVSSEKFTAENANFEYQFEKEGVNYKRRVQYNYFVLLAKDPNQLPFVLSMSSTKLTVAKKLNTIFSRLDRINLPSYSYVIEVRNIKETKDTNSWYGLDLTLGKKTNDQQLDLAIEWYDKIKQSKVIVTDEFEGESSDDENAPF